MRLVPITVYVKYFESLMSEDKYYFLQVGTKQGELI